MQDSKPIDVTRSFVPVNPNSFPENLSSVGREDLPEQHVPVVPYMGYNFIPTNYGYKSYFGTNDKLLFDSILPNKVDRLFMYQTATFRNVVIALCDTGIWYKDSSINGPWIQAVALTAPADTIYAEWTIVTIKNTTYVFRANAANFWKIADDLSTLGVGFTAMSASFITLTAQLGMCRLGGRLAFWDATNALAWCNPDDFTDFTPSITTGANVTTFNSIHGRIVAIRSHGSNAIAYATKSVNLLQISAADTFLVKCTPILPSVGVSYARQSVAGSPDTIHYCYGNTGIFKIENGNPEEIITPMFDYFKEYTSTPIYLRLMEGRQLFFETTDANAILGSVEFSRTAIPAGTITFPGADNDLNVTHNDPNTNVCEVMNLYDQTYFDQHKSQADLAVPPANRKPGTDIKPIYTCYISNHGIKDIDNLAFKATPCGQTGPNGTVFKMTPDFAGDLTNYTTDSSHKTAVSGASMFIDGKWTMERFVAIQSAIWAAEAKAAKAVVEKIKARVGFESKTTVNTTSCSVLNPGFSSCDLGIWPTGFTSPQFGYDMCSFWLTRYVTSQEQLTNKFKTTVDCVTPPSTPLPPTGYWLELGTSGNPDTSTSYASAGAASSFFGGTLLNNGSVTTLAGNGTSQGNSNVAYSDKGAGNSRRIYAYFTAHTGKIVNQVATGAPGTPPIVEEIYPANHWDKVEQLSTHNEGVATVQAPTAETAYCEITGWEYTDTNGNKQTAAATACIPSADRYPGSTSPSGRVIPINAGQTFPLGNEGSVCSIPFPSNLQGITWPNQSVIYAGAEFLTQVGTLAPKYPTFAGAFVYDTALKKWGKLKLDYKQLLDYSPVNSSSSSTVTFATFGIIGSVLKDDGFLYLFDSNPADSKITWGKLGYYRAGFTDLQEMRVDFKDISTGNLTVNVSVDGSAIAADLTSVTPFSGVRSITAYPPFSGKWFTVTVSGKYDVSYMESKGLQKGRR